LKNLLFLCIVGKEKGPRNGKFVTLTPYKKNPPKSMKTPRPTQRKFAFNIGYSTTTTKNKETLHFFRSIYLLAI